MSQTITLTVPDRLYLPLQRVAQATNQPVESLLLTAIQSSLPSLDGLPDAVLHRLTELESLDDEGLWQVMLEKVSVEDQQEISSLLARNESGALTPTEQERLASLQEAADLVMLRKARAAVLLRFRGKRVPTLSELHELANAAA
ncbi:MAG: hypothetical protein ACREEM_40435 [Blastocatellia bacterium]